MLTRQEKAKLKQEFPEGIPGWMFGRGYDADKIRTLMQGRRAIFTPPKGKDPIPPEHHFLVEPEQWDDAVIRNAEYYTVVIGRSPFNRIRREFKTFQAAYAMAEQHNRSHPTMPKAMLYAVTESGRHTMVVPSKWAYYLKLFDTKGHPEGFASRNF